MRWIRFVPIGGTVAVLLAAGGVTSASAYNGYSDVPLCNMMATGTYAPCVQSEPTTPEQSWGNGFKITFTWTTPDDWQGNAYQRCVLEYYNPETQYSAPMLAPVQLDVPADWGTYTFPLSQYGWLMDGVARGATSVETEVYCYTWGIGASTRVNGVADLVPDVVQGAAVDATATPTDDANVEVSARSSMLASTAAGAGALYNVSVSDADGQQAAAEDFATPPADPVQTASAASRLAPLRVSAAGPGTVLAAKASTVVKGLKPGRYTVLVKARGLLGVVTAPARTTVEIPQLTAPSALRAVPGRTSAKVFWKAPTLHDGGKVTGYRVTVRAGKHTVVTRTVGGSRRALRLVKLKARTAYTLTVRAIDSKHHSSQAASRFRTKR